MSARALDPMRVTLSIGLAFPDETSSVITDVARIRNHPLVPRSIPVYGYVYDVRSGQLIEVPAATKIGAAQV
jgi:carbonic anhydrase